MAAFNNADNELTKQMFHGALGARENTATSLLGLSALVTFITVFLWPLICWTSIQAESRITATVP